MGKNCLSSSYILLLSGGCTPLYCVLAIMADTTRFALNLALCEHVCVHSFLFVSMGGEGGGGG